MNFQIEQLSDDLINELLPLNRKHKDEISIFDVELEIAWEAYKKAQKNGLLLVITARDEGKLAGYAVYGIGPHPHYAGTIFGQQDVLYLDPEYRGTSAGIKLIKFSEKCLKERGVVYVLQHTKQKHNLTNYFKRMGYEVCDILLSKRLLWPDQQ